MLIPFKKLLPVYLARFWAIVGFKEGFIRREIKGL